MTLGDLPRLRRGVRRERFASWDRTGGNDDRWHFAPGQTRILGPLPGPGCVRHLWMTWAGETEYLPRRLVFRAWWDGEAEPSIEVPLGDFFGVGHGRLVNFTSLPLTMSPADGRGCNCYFPMPFAREARFAVTNEAEVPVVLYFHLDYERYEDPAAVAEQGRFHAQWRRENPTSGWGDDRPRPWRTFEAEAWRPDGLWRVPNLTGRGNYVILEARGRGHYVGCNLNIDCYARRKNVWYGEGDEMIWVDQEPDDWPPRIHGTGTEDYAGAAYCPREPFAAPFFGIPLTSPGTEDWPWRGKHSLYRFHLEDPIYFERSIRVTIEHGHANHLSLDLSSTAYWYQTEPHAPFPPLPAVAARLPRPDPG